MVLLFFCGSLFGMAIRGMGFHSENVKLLILYY